MILAIETSTKVCSVALGNKQGIKDFKASYEENSHSKYLTVFIEELLKNNGITVDDLDAIAVSEGPGSYTGLRIGVSAAKGLAYAKDKPMIAVDTLLTMVLEVLNNHNNLIDSETLLIPMIDARRMEVYHAVFDAKGNKLTQTTNLIVDQNSFSQQLDKGKVVFFGDGAAKCKDVIKHENAIFIDNINPLATNMIKPACEKLQNKDFVDVAYFEPFYLKPFVAVKSNQKL